MQVFRIVIIMKVLIPKLKRPPHEGGAVPYNPLQCPLRVLHHSSHPYP